MRILFFSLLFSLFIGCSSIRDSAGVSRKSLDEYQVVENPPLVIPPDFNLLPPDQLEEKNLENLETNLAEEILFGLDSSDLLNNKDISTIDLILNNIENEKGSEIRKEIDEGLGKEINSDQFLEDIWENQTEVLDAVKESERLRNKNFDVIPPEEEDIPIIVEKNKKNKKKKRFFFF